VLIMIHRLVLPLALLLLAACVEQPYRRYSSGSAAVAAGERDRGWWPAWMPLSARDVHLQGDQDTNDWWIRARLSPAAADSLRPLLSPVPADSVRVRRPWRSGKWWFEGLIQHHPENDNGLNAALFRGSGTPVPRSVIVAFDRTSDVIFVWGAAAAAGLEPGD
jgi:hypothetical protein